MCRAIFSCVITTQGDTALQSPFLSAMGATDHAWKMASTARPLPPDPLLKDAIAPLWIAPHVDGASLVKLGFRIGRGGVHQSKTMMLRELSALLEAAPDPGSTDFTDLIINRNVLLKGTGSARRLALQRLNGLYGFASAAPIGRVLAPLWQRDDASRPLLALLCSLARDPPLRDTATAVLDAKLGSDVRWPDFASRFEAMHPGRYSANMLRSMSQNCASTWTQSGHLKGRVKKRRVRAIASPVVAAYAALLGELAGFGGATLLASPWIRTLDSSEAEIMALLRQAEGLGLLRLRSGGDVIDIRVREVMASTLGIPDLGNG
jgi:hypothetical protein